MNAETKTKKQNIINGLNYFIPFECGDDPAAWRQKDTVERIQKHLEKVLPDDEDTNLTIVCDHPESGLIPNGGDEFSVIEFTYCPQCGEKL